MNVAELKEILEDMDDDLEVMIAHQPAWPLQEIVSDVVLFPDPNEDRDCENCGRSAIASAYKDGICPHCGFDHDDEPEEDVQKIVYIVAGGSSYKLSPYAPGEIFGR